MFGGRPSDRTPTLTEAVSELTARALSMRHPVPMRWLVTMVLGWIVLGLVVANFALFGLLSWEKSGVSKTSDSSCSVPGGGNSGPYTPSVWRWVPPGRVCMDQGRAFDEPGWSRAVAVIVFPAALVGSLVLLSFQARRAIADSRERSTAVYGT